MTTTFPINYLPKSLIEELHLSDSINDQSSPQHKLQGHQTKIIPQAHLDDIHGLIKLGDNHFLTGSKDGEIHKRTLDGALEKKLQTASKIDYNKWVTSLTAIDQNRWVSGLRNGEIQVRDQDGSSIQTMQCKVFEKFHTKQRNIDRVNCIVALSSKTLAIGLTSCFILYDLEKNTNTSYHQTSKNDWVYTIHPLRNRHLLVATGTELEIYKLTHPYWKKVATVHSQKDLEPIGNQRPFIASVAPLQINQKHVALSLFDGSIRIRDLHTLKEIKAYQEHIGRTWAIANIANQFFASSGEDGLIKIWDLRVPHSVLTLADNNGRISCLLPINDNTLISTSCQSNVRQSNIKAQISFWDIR